jgi:hypothetical protein
MATFTPRHKIVHLVERVEEDVFAAERAAGPTGVTALKWAGSVQHEVCPISLFIDHCSQCSVTVTLPLLGRGPTVEISLQT